MAIQEVHHLLCLPIRLYLSHDIQNSQFLSDDARRDPVVPCYHVALQGAQHTRL